MTDSIGPDKYRDFDEKIPREHYGYDEIREYMNDRYGHVAPQRFIDDVARGVADRREAAGGGELADMASDADGYYDPSVGAFRSESGSFISEDDL